ncbi:MAG TPA: hypothetical protein VKZ53_16150 [Candidatus Angelobacter sp.]|nr:hypothetical protein [Candidatus Angelobacter sp.]
MSLFDYPRINFEGTVQLNPGTANNDDYAQNYLLQDSYGPHGPTSDYKGHPLALIKSKMVEPHRYGMSDADFIAWVQKVQTFDVVGNPGKTAQTIPAEWNYYGDMGSQSLDISVKGVQAGPDGSAGSLSSLVGAKLTFSGVITDVNSEGSPPATQFFFDQVTLQGGNTTYLSGTPSKGACQWLNFYRNVNLTADAGAGGYVYHVFRKGPNMTVNIPGLDTPDVVGVIFRYYLYRAIPNTKDNDAIAKLYTDGKTNPVTLRIAGTFAPLYATETIFTTPVGRLLVANQATIPTPSNHNNGGGKIALAPGVVFQNGNVISADLVGTFPENYAGDPKNPDPKFDFGPVSLVVSVGSSSVNVGPVPYTDVDRGNRQGWIFDFSANAFVQSALRNPDAVFSLSSDKYGNVLQETSHYFVSNQQGIYTEQGGSGTQFLNQGYEKLEPATVSVYQHGRKLGPQECPPITVWQYRSIPLEAPGDADAIAKIKPGDPIKVDTSQPGDFLFTFSIDSQEEPPKSYLDFANPPYITNYPAISLRILPNTVDFRQYYVDPQAEEPIGNERLTFDVVYHHVLRTYYLLYPAMNRIFALNDESAVESKAQGILQVTETSQWMSTGYMPRTRDMSQSRRTLLRAWCRKVLLTEVASQASAKHSRKY